MADDGRLDGPDRADRPRRAAPRAGRPPPVAARRIERYLWDAGFHWGEWLVPGDDSAQDLEAFARADKGDVATAFYAAARG